MPNPIPDQQELSLTDLYKIRDALTILDTYGMVDEQLKQEVKSEIARIVDATTH